MSDNNFPNKSNNNPIKKKFLTNKLICLIIGILIFSSYRIFLPNKETLKDFPYQFNDRMLLDFFNGLTIFLSKNLQLRDLFLLTGFLNLDILLLTFLLHYIKFGNSVKPLIGFLLFYALRGIIQTFFLLDYYPIYLFTYPGFRSISVPTSRAADFFYSGHTGCAFLLSLNFREMGENKIFVYGVIVTLLQIIVMTVSRAHYSIDVIFGFIISHYCFIIANDYHQYINRFCTCFISEENYEKGNFNLFEVFFKFFFV